MVCGYVEVIQVCKYEFVELGLLVVTYTANVRNCATECSNNSQGLLK
jgi:hypothetical protein